MGETPFYWTSEWIQNVFDIITQLQWEPNQDLNWSVATTACFCANGVDQFLVNEEYKFKTSDL